MLAADVMTRELVTVEPTTTVQKAMDLIHANRLHDIPVVDADGKPLGVITGRAILHAALPPYISENLIAAMRGLPDMPSIYEHLNEIADLPVGELMDKRIFSVRPDTPTSAIAAMLVHMKDDTHDILVTDNAGKLVGSISCIDLFFRSPRRNA
ncbi:MAG TPA: CBS domain-containing protein [Mariprofundaceae bacterium]|nr:CBS domain-containing protein [Mariprofundaceae bacterium]